MEINFGKGNFDEAVAGPLGFEKQVDYNSIIISLYATNCMPIIFMLYVVDGPLWNLYEDCSYAFDLVCYYFTDRMFASLKSCCILVYIWFHSILEFTRKTSLGMGKKIAEETLMIGRKFSLHPKGPCAKHSGIAKTLL